MQKDAAEEEVRMTSASEPLRQTDRQTDGRTDKQKTAGRQLWKKMTGGVVRKGGNEAGE